MSKSVWRDSQTLEFCAGESDDTLKRLTITELTAALRRAIEDEFGWPVKTVVPSRLFNRDYLEVNLGDGVKAYCVMLRDRYDVKLELGTEILDA